MQINEYDNTDRMSFMKMDELSEKGYKGRDNGQKDI
jgi:hypothetical protein